MVLQGLIFLGLVLVVLGPVHWYLWRRLVKDTTRPGRVRKIGTVIFVALVVSLIAAFIVPRVAGARAGFAVSLVGYLWLAVMFYLLVIMLALEIPRLIALRLARPTPAHALAPTQDTNSSPHPPADDPHPAQTAPTDSDGAGSAENALARGDAGSAQSAPAEGGAGSAENALARGDAGSAQGAPAGGDAGSAENALARGDAGSAQSAPAGGDAGSAENALAGGDAGSAQGALAGGGGARSVEGAPVGGGAVAEVSRRLLITRSLAIFAGLTATGIVAGGVRTALGDPVLKRVQIPLAKLPRNLDGYRIALVSDIHLGPLTGIDHTRRIVRSINGMQADLIAVVGDLVDGSVAELGAEAQPLADLLSRDGAYFVTGNHEYYSGAQEWIDEVARLGMRPLLNERIGIRGFDLAGVNDVTGRGFPEAGGGPDFAATLGDRDTSIPVVLLAHQPVQATEAAKFQVDLQLSGHTHGGQMVPFNYVARLQQPVISGLGEVDGTKVYVTNGAGFWGPPVRVGAPPDITLVELKAG
ncbi:hypothetical protein Rhe02_92430 [Rhizocola hellebori]|uniref:Calcineurin-like phosphoesterase domain-containing protein n=1 Tax=Rhizocola hellebori TaxID=1392758 RepID=A0A8J3QIB3_9ACTN|nr:metallophosphoesterase [Rhizocola hellebori]GIH11176.1 hypothetical protein Rhe02_92430 [Rhizocola hellebori]